MNKKQQAVIKNLRECRKADFELYNKNTVAALKELRLAVSQQINRMAKNPDYLFDFCETRGAYERLEMYHANLRRVRHQYEGAERVIRNLEAASKPANKGKK